MINKNTFTFIFSFFISFCTVTSAMADNWSYIKAADSDCSFRTGYDDPHVVSGTWSGGCSSGKISGTGKLIIKRNGAIVQTREGIFTDGYQINGKFSNYNGDWFEGTFNNDGMFIHGFGRLNGVSGLYNGKSDGNVVLTMKCSTENGCKKLNELNPKIRQAEEGLKCEEAQTLSAQLDANDRWFSFDSCIGERTFKTELKKTNPQEMYIAAGKYERKDQWNRAEKLYDLIIDRFPSSEFAVKANDKLSLTKRSTDDDTRRRNQSRQECENNKKACFAGCSTLSWEYNGMERATCENKCKEISCY